MASDSLPTDPTEVDLVTYLASAGLTDAEIASAAGLPIEQVQRSPAVLGAGLGALHDARVERALWTRSVGGVTWKEVLDREGGVVRLHSDLPADVGAAGKYLAARMPQAWGERVAHDVQVRIVRDVAAIEARIIEATESDPPPGLALDPAP
jgi:hypothetical protein